MNIFLKQYQKNRELVIKTVEQVPITKWDKPCCGEWDLKDLLGHLSGWAEYQIRVLGQFTQGKAKIDKPKVEDRNQESVAKRKGLTVEQVKNEFSETTAKMIEAYSRLTNEQWQTLIWPGTKTTPEKFIKIEIAHYGKTHLPQIKSLI